MLLGKKIPLLHTANALSLKLDPLKLDDGRGIEAIMRENEALYLASCKLLFNKTKLKWQKKEPHTGSKDNEIE